MTQDEDKQNKTKIHNTGNLKDKQHGSHQTTGGEIKCLLMVSSACFLCLFDIELVNCRSIFYNKTQNKKYHSIRIFPKNHDSINKSIQHKIAEIDDA